MLFLQSASSLCLQACFHHYFGLHSRILVPVGCVHETPSVSFGVEFAYRRKQEFGAWDETES